MPKIAAATEKMFYARKGINKIEVASARPLPQPARKLFHTLLNPKDKVEEQILPELVAGVRITVNDERELDMSLKRKLQKLFSATNSKF